MRTILIPGLLILLNACSNPRYVYAPAPPNNPYFKQKGDSKISAYYAAGGNDGSSSGEQNHGFDVQAAYAITGHWALTADYFSRKEKDVYNYYQYGLFDSSVVSYRRNMVSIGGGYFFGLNKRRKITFNIYGGAGLGKFSISDKGIDDSASVYTRFHRANVVKWYIQPGFNFMPGNYFWCSFTTRFVFTRYPTVNTSYSYPELDGLNLLNLANRTLSFFEPSFNIQFGIPSCPWLKINSGFTLSANLTRIRKDDYVNYHSRTLTAFAGLNFDLSRINKK